MPQNLLYYCGTNYTTIAVQAKTRKIFHLPQIISPRFFMPPKPCNLRKTPALKIMDTNSSFTEASQLSELDRNITCHRM
jgi:hypothetical protein